MSKAVGFCCGVMVKVVFELVAVLMVVLFGLVGCIYGGIFGFKVGGEGTKVDLVEINHVGLGAAPGAIVKDCSLVCAQRLDGSWSCADQSKEREKYCNDRNKGE